ncbi:MAG: hypothetical protein HY238_25130 [Acidobacteria bacterium]|nr:hypothetical protein [Acidobacteriota bacterium]
MRRATITLPDDLDAALNSYIRQQDVGPALTALVQSALREYLATRGYLVPARRLRISAARKGSGKKDLSVEHDRYFAER